MKCYGKIVDFDGYVGNIKGVNGKDYLFLCTDIVTGGIQIDDYVSFDCECYEDIELKKNMARFVKKMDKVDIDG